ncbi:MAG TPA: hypothetical protein VES60_06995 [Nakamurella sp.]|nr:hypothetical protein [Nakamurella sp.]
MLARFARLLEARAEEIARLESRQAGKPIRLTREFDVPRHHRVPGTIESPAPSTTSTSSPAPRSISRARPPPSAPPTTPPASGGNRSASSDRSHRGTTRCRWQR